MQASSLASHLKRRAAVQDWHWSRLPSALRAYVALVPIASIVVIGVAGVYTDWRLSDLVKFLLLMFCGMISVASTPKIMYTFPGVTRDFSSIWVLPAAVLLPPFYAAIVPISFSAVLNIFVHRGILHRAVFSAAAQSLSYAAASIAFRWFPVGFAGGHVGVGSHAFTWCVAVAACEILGGRAQHFLIVGAVKLSNPIMKIWRIELDRDSLQALFVEIDLGVLITLAVAVSPALVLIALPTVLLVRRFMVFPILEAQSRTDAKTGLLNVSTWESEADLELSRSIRNRNPVALCLVDIDHFKQVNDTYGHLAGDRVLKALAEALTSQSRDYDRVGRFGGEEFVLLLAQTGEEDAKRIAQRLRGYVEGLTIPIDDRADAATIQITISIGVTAVARGGEAHELTDLLAAADSAMYHAKQAGRNRVAYAAVARDMGLDAALGISAPEERNPALGQRGEGAIGGTPLPAGRPLAGHQVVLVQAEQAAASLCLCM